MGWILGISWVIYIYVPVAESYDPPSVLWLGESGANVFVGRPRILVYKWINKGNLSCLASENISADKTQEFI